MPLRPLVLNNIALGDIDCPEELLASVHQSLSVKDYNGGKRIIQSFGVFPPKQIAFKATLIPPEDDGALTVEDQNEQLADLLRDQKPVTLKWGPLNYTGFVMDYLPNHKNQSQIDYELVFVPLKDPRIKAGNSGGGSGDPLGGAMNGLGNLL